MAGGGKTKKVLPRIQWTMGHEMGVMFGFIALFIIVTVAFAIFWVGKNKRQARAEHERQEALRQAGWGLSGWKNTNGEYRDKAGAEGVQTAGEERVERVPQQQTMGANGGTEVREKGSMGELR